MDFIYHIFPLGSLGAPRAHGEAPPTEDPGLIDELPMWIPHLKELGVTSVLLGPVTHSESHGYDTFDLHAIDPRIGSNQSFAKACQTLREAGIGVILDAVFNHVGRNFFAFQDLFVRGATSPYVNWFHGIDFSRPGPEGEPFAYDTWDGHSSLIKLDVTNPEVEQYLLEAVAAWIRDYNITGLRLDAADVIDPSFWPRLREAVGPDVLLIGEMVHGDYRSITGPDMLDSITNYECYKGFYSSLNDRNMFEIAWSLNRQFGTEGIYRDLNLYNFVDNHDVPRIASTLQDERTLYPLHVLLFSVPGIPSVYYGSEVGIPGTKGLDDWNLRPRLRPQDLRHDDVPHPDLPAVISRMAALRASLPALSDGTYLQVHVEDEQLLFLRGYDSRSLLVMINVSEKEYDVPREAFQAVYDSDGPATSGIDHLNGGERVFWNDDRRITVAPFWARIIELN